MSSTKAYQCLSCRLKSAFPPNISTRSFHASPASQARRSRRARNIKASDLNLTASAFKPYTEEEKRLLAEKYTPAQMKVIEAGERAVSPRDMARGRMRDDPMRIKYVDDFSELRPFFDRDLTPEEQKKMREQQNSGVGPEGRQRSIEEELEDTDPQTLRLCQQTGLSVREIRNIHVKVLLAHRVVNQTRMGKIQSLYFLSLAGNRDGMLGIGEGKAAAAEDGERQAKMSAIRNMQPIARYEDRTIYGDVQAKVGASVVQLSSRPPGFGNRCQHLVFELARAAGISDLSARTPRSRNGMNVVKAAFEALRSQRLPDDVARGRGRKMVDVRKVYYGGSVS